MYFLAYVTWCFALVSLPPAVSTTDQSAVTMIGERGSPSP